MKNTVIFLVSMLFLFISCTFDYGSGGDSDDTLPDLIMINVDYVRVRSADPLARIFAERVERFEKQNLMKLENVTFEQYGERGEEVYILGKTGNAVVEIGTGDIFMDRNVRIEVTAEDIILETSQLEWKDDQKILSTGENDEVFIYRENGTSFTGTGLSGNARNRTWEFSGSVRGTYVHENSNE